MSLAPGDVVGILGAGQLARMLAMAAARLGLRSHIFAPETEAPAYEVAGAKTIADYNDEAALARFAAEVDAITYEFENVPVACAEFLNRLKPVRPSPRALAITQDRLAEKSFLRDLGLATAPFAAIDNAGSLARAIGEIGRPAILKTRRMGYDGKGQALIREGSNLTALHRSLGGAPCILEGFVNFEREASVIAARGVDGAMAAFDLCENEHEDHILARTHLPARVAPATEAAAKAIAAQILTALDYVGVLAVELFVTREASGAEGLVVNELAPRVHNSGHWTLEGAEVSQFEQHIRAIAGWPLGSTRRFGAIEMHNLIGAEVEAWRDILARPELSLHLYGKMETRPGRKMGHVTQVMGATRDA